MGTSQVVQVGKNPPANAGDVRDRSSIPGSGRSPGRGNGNPLQYSCLENPTDRRSWRAVVHRLQSWIQLKWFSTHPDVQWACPKWFHCVKGQGVGPFSGLFRAVREHSVRGDPCPIPDARHAFLLSRLRMSVQRPLLDAVWLHRIHSSLTGQ